MAYIENLFSGRIVSIDVFRGLTIFVMVFVNELAGVADVPGWLKHALPEQDGMTLVDLVFPAFLFIVGMSIPFSMNARLKHGDSVWQLWKHIGARTLALWVMGLYMVNTQYGYDETKMLVPMALWGLLAYSLPILIWNQYPAHVSVTVKRLFQYSAIVILVAMYFVYVQDSGARGMTPKWWGILGLIGWAYLFACILYWLSNGNTRRLLAFWVLCLAISTAGAASREWSPMINVAGLHFTHTVIVVTGIITSLLFFTNQATKTVHIKLVCSVCLIFVIAYLLRPYFGVSKIRATPSWGLYSAAFCMVGYCLMHQLLERTRSTNWYAFIMPAAENPLLIYILPGIILYLDKLIGIDLLPASLSRGVPGMLWCLTFTILMLYAVKVLNRWHIRLRL